MKIRNNECGGDLAKAKIGKGRNPCLAPFSLRKATSLASTKA
jgi:hypothetical protein